MLNNELATRTDEHAFDVLREVVPNRDEILKDVADKPPIERCSAIMAQVGLQVLVYALMGSISVSQFARFFRLREAAIQTWVASEEDRQNQVNKARDAAYASTVDQVIADTLTFDVEIDEFHPNYLDIINAKTKQQKLRADTALHLDKHRRVKKKEKETADVIVYNDYSSVFTPNPISHVFVDENENEQ